MNQMAIC